MRRTLALLLSLSALALAGGRAESEAARPRWTPHASWDDAPHSATVARGLEWLVSVQGRDGGWGQDGGRGGAAPRRGALPAVESEGNDVANTSLAALALLRAGTTPTDGPYREALLAATRFVVDEIERGPEKGLAITRRTGTQIQRKLGPHIDTFLAAMHLTQVDGRIPDAELSHRVNRALRRCVAEIEAHQDANGGWGEGAGWAPVMSQAFASRSLSLARERGLEVDEEVVKRAREHAYRAFDRRTGRYVGRGGSAGVQLYDISQVLEEVTRAEGGGETTPYFFGKALERLNDREFVAGFGSMGGEEFMSYLNISDGLVRRGGEAWLTWNDRMTKHLGSLQNEDGTWAGHHCITGRTACTAAAVLTLLAERTAPKPAGP